MSRAINSFRGFVFAIVAIHFGYPAFSAERSHSGTLLQVYPLASGDFVVVFTVSPSNCSNASNPKYVYVAVGQNGMTTSGSAKVYAAAMSALVAGLPVNIAYDDATAFCYLNRLTVNAQ